MFSFLGMAVSRPSVLARALHATLTASLLFWSSYATAATYYVSESSGSDDHTGLSHAQAWRELDVLEDKALSPGDKVLFLCGDTWNRDEGDWGSGETSIKIGDISGLTIGAYYDQGGTPTEVDGSTHTCPADNPTIDGNVLTHADGMSSLYYPALRIVANSDNITVQDLKVQNYNAGVLAAAEDGSPGPITNGVFQRLETYNTGRYGINLTANPRGDDNVSDWTVANCKIIRSYMAFEGLGGWGIALSLKHVDNYTVYGNEVGQSHGEGIAGWGGADNGEIANNLVYETGSVSIYLSCCHNVNVHHNYVAGTNNSYWKQGNGRTLGGIGFGGETDEQGFVDSSGCTFHNNVVFGRDAGGFSVTDANDDGDGTADGGHGTNYVYNNTFIDNNASFWLFNSDAGELTITFANNLSVVNDTANSCHVSAKLGPHYTWLGNGWDESVAVDPAAAHGNDVVGDPAIVNETPCSGGWHECTAHDTPSWGDAAFTASSEFLDNAQSLSAAYSQGLDPASSWPGAVTTRDQDSYGAGWEFGAYVFDLCTSQGGECCDADQVCEDGVEKAVDGCPRCCMGGNCEPGGGGDDDTGDDDSGDDDTGDDDSGDDDTGGTEDPSHPAAEDDGGDCGCRLPGEHGQPLAAGWLLVLLGFGAGARVRSGRVRRP